MTVFLARIRFSPISMLLRSLVLGALPLAAIAQEQSQPAWVEAAQWARSHDELVVHVELGSDAGHSPEVIRDFFEAGFLNQYQITARVFVEQTDTPGTIVSYYFDVVALKPIPFDQATSADKLDEIARRYRALP